MSYETNVRHHIRRKPKGGYGEVVKHQRTIEGSGLRDGGTTIVPYSDDVVIVNPTPKEGGLFAKRMFGRNLMLRAYRFGDKYKVYAYRRDNNRGKDSWTESSATSYGQTKNEILKNLRSYKKVSDFTLLHPVLRDEGTSMSKGYNYSIYLKKG